MKNRKLWYEFPFSYFFFCIFCLLTSIVRCRQRGSLCISINFINNSISQKIIWTAPKENKKVSTPQQRKSGMGGEGGWGESMGKRGSWHWARGFGFLWFLGPLRKYFLQYNNLSKSFQFLKIKKKNCL